MKEAQLDFFSASTYAENRQDWIINARLVARRIALTKGSVNADDIHREFPPPSEWAHKNCVAAVFKGMKMIGTKKSEREECHHRPIAIFTVGDA